MYIQKICCEDQAHSHRLTFIQKPSSPLAMFYGFLSGKKNQQSAQKDAIMVTEGHDLIPRHVTAVLCGLGYTVRSISGGVNPATSPTPQAEVAAHTEFS